MVSQGLKHMKPRGQGGARHAALLPAQGARDAAIRRQHAGIIVGAAKLWAPRKPLPAGNSCAPRRVDRSTPAILETTAQQVPRLGIAAARGAEKTGEGSAPIAGHAIARQKYPSQPQLGLDQTAGRRSLQPVGGFIPAKGLPQFGSVHRGQSLDPPGLRRDGMKEVDIGYTCRPYMIMRIINYFILGCAYRRGSMRITRKILLPHLLKILSFPFLTPWALVGISRDVPRQAVCGKNRKNAVGKPV